MTFDPYTNRILQGLMTDEEKAALLATGGPWEIWDGDEGLWRTIFKPQWINNGIYRAVRKPLPVPQEGDVWVHSDYGYSTHLYGQDSRDMIRKGYRLFREVKA
jgi:hypothetical protein